MESTTKTTDKTGPGKPSFFNSLTQLLVLVTVFLALVIAGIYIRQHRRVQPAKLVSGSSGPSLSLMSGELNPIEGSTFTVSVWEDSGSQGVNAVQANINYPIDKFQVVSIDDSDSAFEIKAQTTGKDGQIIIARGHKGSLTGRQLVAVINFKAADKPSASSLNFAPGSVVLNAITNKDVLGQSSGLNLTIEAK